jgi:hypothetical protein
MPADRWPIVVGQWSMVSGQYTWTAAFSVIAKALVEWPTTHDS